MANHDPNLFPPGKTPPPSYQTDFDESAFVVPPRPRRRWWRVLAWALPTVVLLAGVLGLGTYLYVLSHISLSSGETVPRKRADVYAWPLRMVDRLNVLIIGVDVTLDSRRRVTNVARADTLALVTFDPERERIAVMSIPRDTRVDPPNLRVRRINEVYAYAYRASKRDSQAALEALWGTVSSLLFTSTAPPPLHFYAQIDYDGFRKIIDLLGGVDVTVDEPMHYDDFAGNLHIHFSTGAHHLDGQKSMEYVRYRESSGDAGRVSRQQEFLLKALRRLASPAAAPRLPALAGAALRAVESNLSGYDCLLAIHELRGIARERVRLIQLPGSAKRGYWVPDAEGMKATAGMLGAAGDDAAQEDFSKVTVEVWNASSRKGLALEVVRALRDAGFDVVKWGNFASRQKKTFVRDHRGDPRAAQAVARALRTPDAEVFTRMETDPLVDVEVVLGQDYSVLGGE